MSRHHARTFAEFFKTQQSKIPAPKVSPNPKRPDYNFIETPRELPGHANALEDREIHAFVLSMMGGTRTIAPHPQRVRNLDHREAFVPNTANTEMKPRVHVAKPKPTALEIEAKAVARDKAKALALARTHAKALREAADAAEARLAAMES